LKNNLAKRNKKVLKLHQALILKIQRVKYFNFNPRKIKIKFNNSRVFILDFFNFLRENKNRR